MPARSASRRARRSAVPLLVLLLVTYVPAVPMGLVDFFYR